MNENVWPAEWLRGVLEICVLQVISAGPTYGYAIATRLAEAGLGTIKGGTLYPLLNRCEQSRLIEAEWRAGESGPGRKFYTLTAAGSDELDRRTAQWRAFTETTLAFVDVAQAQTVPTGPESAAALKESQ